FVTLFDHLVYAIERSQKHIVLPNRLLWEVRRFYPREYAPGAGIRPGILVQYRLQNRDILAAQHFVVQHALNKIL
ncbi:PRD domain-containing protein, partial [Gemmiger formicilis]|uniref:PRD domain-containing protein n=1 Tax=Gemmiger formicilis TaxID=745368 RepID=UPI00195AF477